MLNPPAVELAPLARMRPLRGSVAKHGAHWMQWVGHTWLEMTTVTVDGCVFGSAGGLGSMVKLSGPPADNETTAESRALLGKALGLDEVEMEFGL